VISYKLFYINEYYELQADDQLMIVPIIIHYHRYKAESRRKQKGLQLIATILKVHVAIVWICLTSIETCTEKTNGYI